MRVGDYISVSDAGEIQVIEREAYERDQGGGGTVKGVVVDVREPLDDSVIELQISEENVEGVYITLGNLKEQSGSTFGGANS